MTGLRLGCGLHKRLDQLEPVVRPVGCPTCCGWTWVVLEGDDGAHRPEQCPDCGRLVPATIIVRIVGVAIAAI